MDWINNDSHYNYFSTDGNMLAILFDIADTNKAKHIIDASHIFDIHETPSQCVHPPYSKNLISRQTKSFGLGDYHNGISWLWLGAISAVAKYKTGYISDAKLLLEKMSKLIVKYNKVYEVYEKTGEPVNRFLYKSEYPFAWSSGLFLYAVNKIKE